jgi:hypothetical protein
MARGTVPFKQSDVTRAVRGAAAAGVEIVRIEIDTTTGSIIILTSRAADAAVAPYDMWKAESRAR